MEFGRFVALGDSLTEGKGDPDPDGCPRGFADLLAMALRDRGDRLSYANLARPSVRASEVLDHQVPAAVALQPDLITVVAGVNDVIALRFDGPAVSRTLTRLLGGLRRGCPTATILTATLPDLGHLNRLARAWSWRIGCLNAAVREAAAIHGVGVVDLAAGPPMVTADLAPDRVHPSPRGHLAVAEAFGQAVSCPVPRPAHMAERPRAEAVHRAWRTAVVAPRFVAKRLARRALIAGQPAKQPDLRPV